MRIFIGIDLDPKIQGKIARFIEGVSGFAPDARWVRQESLHVTLKFIGEQTPEQLLAIREGLRRVRSEAFELRVAGYGFFPTEKAPRVFWIGISAGPVLADLAARIDATVAQLGVPREDRPYSPHLTLARGGGRAKGDSGSSRERSGDPKWRKGDGPNSTFSVLQKRLEAMGAPEFGTMAADKFILYQSQLLPGGSKYTKLESFPLRPGTASA